MSHTRPHTTQGRLNISRAKTGKPNVKIRREVRIVKGYEYYKCPKCSSWKMKNEFYKAKNYCGIASYCIECEKATAAIRNRIYRQRRKQQ